MEVTNFVWLVMAVFVVFDVMLYNKRIDSFLESKPWGIRWSVYAILLGCILMFAGTVKHPFVYFQF